MDLRNKYFHSVIAYDIEGNRVPFSNIQETTRDILSKYEKILNSGYILSLNDIKKIYGDSISRNIECRYNGDDWISISRYKNNPEIIDLGYKNDRGKYFEDGYKEFVVKGLSFVLNESIWTELKHKNFTGIYLERFICEPIPLKYMDAIALCPHNFFIKDFFNNKSNFEGYEDIFERYYGMNFLDTVISLLNRYGYNVPIVDITNGKEYQENIEYRRFLSKQ